MIICAQNAMPHWFLRSWQPGFVIAKEREQVKVGVRDQRVRRIPSEMSSMGAGQTGCICWQSPSSHQTHDLAPRLLYIAPA